MASSSSSSSSRSRWKHDVFLSFRGEDTRKNFTDHLFTALNQKGIIVFRDDEKLERGKPISPELLKAIEESRYSVVVFSRNYATSSWCLDEVAKIVECMNNNEMGQTIFPVFYDVSPAEVRKQSGCFEKAFQKHEQVFGADQKVLKWRAALTQVANLSGWDLQDKHESTFIQEIVQAIWTKLSHSFSNVPKDLVGMGSRLQEMSSCLYLASDDVRIIGICGMGGLGKTTIARFVYERFCDQFEGSSFIANVREVSEKFGLPTLQEQLLSETLAETNMHILGVHKGINIASNRLRRKRVFIILDDVDKLEQLQALAGNHEWFGPGSRIVVTTRDEHLLNAHGVDVIYKAISMDGVEALQLFSLKAFKQNPPTEDHVHLSKQVVTYADGLPLALVVLGSFLCGRSVNEWRSALKRLKEIPNREIFDVLRISFDGLEETEKNIFLDISCFFTSKKLDRVTEKLDACDLYPEIGLRVLIDKSLISVDNFDRIYVHNLLQEMAWTIVHQESPKDPGRRSRLWLYKDINHVLTSKTGTEAIEVIYRNSSELKEISADADAFSRMNLLRLLKFHGVNLPKGLDFLPNELRILKWHGYPLKFLPSTFKPEKLVQLKMPHSGIELLWKGIMDLENLKVVKLSHSKNLIRTPDFSGVPNLERLILEGCTSLYQLHPSIGDLKKLLLLNLKDCRNLQSLPSRISGWKSLKALLLLGCSKIDKLPENLGDFECLEELDVGLTAMTEVPSSIVYLKNLKLLSFRGCKGRPLPWNWFQCLLPPIDPISRSLSLPSLVGLKSLTALNLSDCSLSEGAIPGDIWQLSGLRMLDLSRNDFVNLPASIHQLTKLQNLDLECCQRLQALPELPSSIEKLNTYNCMSLKTLANPMGLCTSNLREFSLSNCFSLVENQGDQDNVAFSLLKHHLLLVAKIQTGRICSKFLDMVDSQGSCSSEVAMLLRSIRSAMNVLLEGLLNQPFVMPKLWILQSASKIPDWFTHQTTRTKFTIELPPDWYNDSALLGLAFCATFELQEHHGQEQRKAVPRLPLPIKNVSKSDYKLRFYLISDGGRSVIFGRDYCFDKDRLAQTDHRWLHFLPFDEHFKNSWRSIDAYFILEGPGFEFKKCGFRLINLMDIVFDETMFERQSVTQMRDHLTFIRNCLVQAEARVSENENKRRNDGDQPGPNISSSSSTEDQVGPSRNGSCDEESVDPVVDIKGKQIEE